LQIQLVSPTYDCLFVSILVLAFVCLCRGLSKAVTQALCAGEGLCSVFYLAV
jgi:hypothetical protein